MSHVESNSAPADVKLTDQQKRLVVKIQRLHRQGRPLNITAVRRSDPRLLAAVYGVRPFWGWKRAIEAAGLDYSRIKIHLAETVACQICWQECGQLSSHLRHAHDMSPTAYRQRHPHAELTSEAIIAQRFRSAVYGPGSATAEVPHWEPVWSPEYVLDRLAEFARRGEPLHCISIVQRERSFYQCVLRYFGKWDLALNAAGLDPATERCVAAKTAWTRRQVVVALKARYAAGHPCHWSAVKAESNALARAALKHFGTYDAALRGSHLQPARIRRIPVRRVPYQTESDVREGIQRRQFRELPLNSSAMFCGPTRDLPLYMKARRLFGSWRKAVEAAGVSWNTVTRAVVPHFATAAAVLDEIRRRGQAGQSLLCHDIRRAPDHGNLLYERALKFFGRWNAAVGAARGHLRDGLVQ